MSTRLLSLGALALFTMLGCGPGDQRTDTMDPQDAAQVRANMPPEVVAALDSGTAAFRADDAERALAHYTRATELAPEVAAGWFGVYMAQHQLGDLEAAQEALRRARELAPEASMIHQNGSGGSP